MPLNDEPSTIAPIRQPVPKARLVTIREAIGKSSMAKARSKSYRNALPPSTSIAETVSESSSSNGRNYLTTIFNQLSASPPRAAPLHVKDTSASEKQWIEETFQSYADHFHHRWHIITAATYEFNDKPFDNAASVIMIGCYFSEKQNSNNVCIDIHHKLVDQYTQLLDNILGRKIIHSTMRRLETYQSIVLNIIFALLSNNEEIIAKADSLCGLFIETLRVTGFLNQLYAQEVLQTEFPGSYGPWVGMITDEWKRLVCNLFKIEARMSLDCQRRPRLHYNELETTLTSPFSVRNCYDMDVFVHRQRFETMGRHIQLSSMIKHPELFLPVPLLVEDIHLGLCGLTVEILEHEYTRFISGTLDLAAARLIRDSVTDRLTIWLAHIEDATQRLTSDARDPTDDALLVNYLAQESPRHKTVESVVGRLDNNTHLLVIVLERLRKCNEVHPRCLQCERANLACSFSSPTLTKPPLNEDSLADLELLEHWHRYPVTGDMTETTRQLQHDLVRLGFSHHYLLNSILGLTALQLYSEDRSQSKWYIRAVAHQQTAITRARPHFESLTQAHEQALLGFSAFMSMYAVAEPIHRPSGICTESPFDPVEELLKALRFSRSTIMFVQQSFPLVVVSGSWLLTKFAAHHQDTGNDLETRYPQLEFLQKCITSQVEGVYKKACFHAVKALFRRIATLSDNIGDPEPAKIVWGWGLDRLLF
ncbi:hypothetical protein FDENT_10000 [Fusarium denticulatum]|uniref:Uncharacterized protein n=1 Tax=Fusarium denticulatum TaxID=48507 RepID=A0A8H5TP00_9HYPO|nr:hypothetical protein FDENT_10000 [Fusarium denticulatum]